MRKFLHFKKLKLLKGIFLLVLFLSLAFNPSFFNSYFLGEDKDILSISKDCFREPEITLEEESSKHIFSVFKNLISADYSISLTAEITRKPIKGEKIDFDVAIENKGNQDGKFIISLTSNLPQDFSKDFCIDDACYFKEATIFLKKGEKKKILVSICPPLDLKQKYENLSVTINAQSKEDKNIKASLNLYLYTPLKTIITLTINSTLSKINEKTFILEAPPFIENARTFVPVRFISEAIGAKVLWDQQEQKITIQKDSKLIILYIGKNFAIVDSKKIQIDKDILIVPKIINGRTFVPVRFIAETLGFEVLFDSNTKTITLILEE